METEGDTPFNPNAFNGNGNSSAFSATGTELILAAPRKDHDAVVAEIQSELISLPTPKFLFTDVQEKINNGSFTPDTLTNMYSNYEKLYNTTVKIENRYMELNREFDQSEENRGRISGLIEYSEKTYNNTESQALILRNEVTNLETELMLYKENNNLLLSKTERLDQEKKSLLSQLEQAALIVQKKTEEMNQLVEVATQKIESTDASANERLNAQESQLIRYNSINQDLQNQIEQFNSELQNKNQKIDQLAIQILQLNQNILTVKSEEQQFRDVIYQQKQQEIVLKQQTQELKLQIQNEFNERIKTIQEEKRIVIAQLNEKTEEIALIRSEQEQQNTMVVYAQQSAEQNEKYVKQIQGEIQQIQQEALLKDQNSALLLQKLEANIESLQMTLTTTVQKNESLVQQLELERNRSQIVVSGSEEDLQQNQMIIASQNIELETIKAEAKRYADELKKEIKDKKIAEEKLLKFQGESQKAIQTLRNENDKSKRDNEKKLQEAKLNAQKIQSEVEITKSAKDVAEKKATEFKEKAEKEEKALVLSKKEIAQKDGTLLSTTREKTKLEKEIILLKKNLELKEKTTIPQAELQREQQEKQVLLLQLRKLEDQLAAQSQQLIIVQQQEQPGAGEIFIEVEKSKTELQSTKRELESLKSKNESLEKAQKDLAVALGKIKINIIDTSGIITPEKIVFDVKQENNKALLRLTPEIKKELENAIKQYKLIQKLTIYDGTGFKSWTETKISLDKINLIPNNILNELIIASTQGIVPSGGGGSIVPSKKPSSTKPKSKGEGSGTSVKKASVGALVIYDSSLHPMYHLEMILQQNMFNLSASPSVSSDNALYTVEVKFQTGIESNPTDQLCFIARNVTLQEAPEGGRQAYIVSLGKDKKIDYTNIGLLSKDCIFERGILSLKIIDLVNNSVVKEEDLRYLIEPQINQPPYNTRAAVDISKGIKFYVRALGKGTYFLEMMVIYQ